MALISCAVKAVYLAAFKETCLFLAFIPNPRWLGLMNSSNRMGTSVRRNFKVKLHGKLARAIYRFFFPEAKEKFCFFTFGLE